MLPELSGLWAKIETWHQEMFDLIDELKPKQLLFKPEPDRWSMLQVLQHVVLGAQGMRRSEAEMRDNPLREILKPGEMVKLVKLSFSFRRQKSDQKRPEFRVGFNNFRHLLF